MTVENKYKWGTLISCSVSCFIGFIDFAIVNTALPAIQESLSASFLQLQWIMNAFILAMSVLLASTGRIADLFGRRLVNIIGVAIFGAFSLLAGFTSSAAILIFCRFMQGVGIASIIPSSLGLISHAFPGNEKGKAIGIWASITGLGMALGPVVGGILVSALSWRWVFYINVPFAIASLLLNFLFVKESKDTTSEKKIDPKGFILLTIGITSLVTALMHTPDWGWSSWKTLLLFAIAIFSLGLFYRAENKCSHPIIPFTAFANRTFLACTVVVCCLILTIVSSFFFIPLYLQNIRHDAPYISGLMMLPISGMITIFSPFVGQWSHKVSLKLLMLAGLFCFIVSTSMQAFFHEGTGPYFVLASFVIMGIAWTLCRGPATSKALSVLPPHLAGTAAGVLWTLQNIAGAVGLALTGTLFRTYYQHTDVTFLIGYHLAMWLLAAIALLSFLYIAIFAKD